MGLDFGSTPPPEDPNDPNRPRLPVPPANRRSGQPLPGSMNAGPPDPNPGYQNPGAMLAQLQAQNQGQPLDISDGQRQSFLQMSGGGDLPPANFSSPPMTNPVTTIQPGQLNALARGGPSAMSGGSGPGAPPAPVTPGMPTPPPAIFNAGAQSAPDVAIPFAGGATPAGYRQTISADGGPGHLQQILPGERGAGGQDMQRQGLSLAEVQAANPHLDVIAAYALQQRLQAQNAADQMRTAGLRTDQRNIGQGLMDNATRTAIGQSGLNPAIPFGAGNPMGTSQRNAATAESQAAYDTGGGRLRDTIVGGIIAQGGTGQDVAEGLSSAGLPAAGSPLPRPGGPTSSQPTASGTPAVGIPPAGDSQLHRTLDQHLQAAAGLPAQPRGSRVPIALPADTKPDAANSAITNFVHSIASSGLLTPQSLPDVMSYMTQRFGANRVNPWFQQSFGLMNSGTPHQASVETMQDAMRRAGVDVGTQRNVAASSGYGDILNLRNWFR